MKLNEFISKSKEISSEIPFDVSIGQYSSTSESIYPAELLGVNVMPDQSKVILEFGYKETTEGYKLSLLISDLESIMIRFGALLDVYSSQRIEDAEDDPLPVTRLNWERDFSFMSVV